VVLGSIAPAVYYAGIATSGLFGFNDAPGGTPGEVPPGWIAFLVAGLAGGLGFVGVLAWA